MKHLGEIENAQAAAESAETEADHKVTTAIVAVGLGGISGLIAGFILGYLVASH